MALEIETSKGKQCLVTQKTKRLSWSLHGTRRIEMDAGVTNYTAP